jgi:hypothetical protein
LDAAEQAPSTASAADITRHFAYVRFTAENGHRPTRRACPLCANGDLTHLSKSGVDALRRVERQLCGEWTTVMEILSFASLGEIDVINNSRQDD